MEYYEIESDIKDRFIFQYRLIKETTPHYHGAIEILFVEKGEQEVVINGEKKTLKSGEACFSDSFSVHSYIEDCKEQSYLLIVDKIIFDQVIAQFDGKVPPVFFKFNHFRLLNELYKLYVNMFKTCQNSFIVANNILGILLLIISKENDFLNRETSSITVLVMNILSYANEHISNDLSMEILSEKFNYSKGHLSRLLHKYLCENWSTYISRKRVELANDMILKYSEKTIVDIAFSCGFNSVATFYRTYKDRYGKNPKRS